MSVSDVPSDGGFETRLFLEEICCNLCRFLHAAEDGLPPEAVRIDQETALGGDAGFADIYVQPLGRPAYAVEVKYGYTSERLLSSLRRKYGPSAPTRRELERVVLVVDTERADWPTVEREVKAALRPGLTLDIWHERRLIDLMRTLFGVTLDSFSETDLVDVRHAIDRAKGEHAFGAERNGDPLEAALLWHFGFWRLRQLRDAHHVLKRSVLPPGLYRDVVVLMADLTSFSSYVRDSPEREVVRQSLEAFYAKARYQIINAGGMMFQFIGDGVLAFFGVPDRPSGYLSAALDCASALADIGRSVMSEWQRQIDRVQVDAGMHTGMAMGDFQLFSQRPFGREHIGAVGDPVNIAARLCAAASTSEVVVSNTFYQRLDASRQARFRELETLDPKNVGRIRAWTTRFGE